MTAFKYILFAVIATGLNLLFQFFSLQVYSGLASLYLAMAVGTIAGLLCKYILDKKYIFYQPSQSVKQDAGRFMLYSLTGVFTTAIFWGTEIAFDFWLAFDAAKYIGGALGLATGYVLKFFLDRQFVFRESAS